jgi:protein AATF/BFR2
MEIPLERIKRKREDDMDDWIESTLADVLKPLMEGFDKYRNETIDKWNNRVQMANGMLAHKKFKVINQSLVSQIEYSYQNREKLVKKAHLNRSNYKIIGKKVNLGAEDETKDRHLNDYDEQIYDDGDYYQQLLKEFIDSRMQETNDPAVLALRHAQLKRLQAKKSKKHVDTKASKGRKIRYQVHEKIQNFMAPEPRGTWHEEMCEELFSSLLGHSKISKQNPDSISLSDGFRLM